MVMFLELQMGCSLVIQLHVQSWSQDQRITVANHSQQLFQSFAIVHLYKAL